MRDLFREYTYAIAIHHWPEEFLAATPCRLKPIRLKVGATVSGPNHFIIIPEIPNAPITI